MVAPHILRHPALKTWLGGVEPVWSLLPKASFWALHHPPSPSAGPIRLAADLTTAETRQSAVARNALVLLNAAAAGPGLKLTATGNLSRAVVAQMCDLITFPDFDKRTEFSLNKVINELDFLPLYFVRHVAAAAALLRRYKGRLRATRAGRRLLEGSQQGALQAILFHIAFWRLNLGYFDRGPHEGWPQNAIGIVLWSLSIAADDWRPPTELTRLCAIPVDGVLAAQYDTATWLMEARILRPLQWFGLLELRREPIPGDRFGERRLYRKTPLFDRFLSFEVKLQNAGGVRH